MGLGVGVGDGWDGMFDVRCLYIEDFGGYAQRMKREGRGAGGDWLMDG